MLLPTEVELNLNSTHRGVPKKRFVDASLKANALAWATSVLEVR